jgi:hypothetical protein
LIGAPLISNHRADNIAEASGDDRAAVYVGKDIATVANPATTVRFTRGLWARRRSVAVATRFHGNTSSLEVTLSIQGQGTGARRNCLCTTIFAK